MDLLLDREFVLHPSDNQTNILVPFETRRDYDLLEFTCAYSPKKVDDLDRARALIEEGIKKYLPAKLMARYGNWEDYLPLVNHITFSLDYEGRYVGCAHRHAPEQTHTISAEGSAPGFFRQAACRGSWRAVLNVHALVSDEVRYRLTVRGKMKEEA